MLEYVLWGISFVSLWLTLVWLNFLYADQPKNKLSKLPKVTFGVPAYNEEIGILKTLQSLVAVDYPSRLKEIVVVDDGSKDSTAKVVKQFMKANPKANIKFFRKVNGGKASALNVALQNSSGELFAVVDADSRISENSVKVSVQHFADVSLGAVISRVRVDEPKNFLERMQRFEYIMSSMTRKIMCNFGTLSITPGVLSMYKTGVLRKLGGFTTDKENLTEDLEIAMRLKFNGYSIRMEPESITYTRVPSNIAALWRQRVRWARGYIYNHIKYRSMFFSKKHGLLGGFQMPVNVLAVLLLIVNIGIISYDLLHQFVEFTFRSLTIPDYFINRITDWPSVQEFVLARNIQVYLPIIVALILGIYLIMFAHRLFKEHFRQQLAPLVSYVIVMPYFTTLNWVSSIYSESRKTKRKW